MSSKNKVMLSLRNMNAPLRGTKTHHLSKKPPDRRDNSIVIGKRVCVHQWGLNEHVTS